jgi:hypothetical protein
MLLLMLSLLVSLCICCKAPVYVLCVVRAILFEATACSSIYVLVLILSLSLSLALAALDYLSRLSLYIRSYVLLLLPGVFMSCRAHCWLGYHCRVNGVA